jgi:hypothetical protein
MKLYQSEQGSDRTHLGRSAKSDEPFWIPFACNFRSKTPLAHWLAVVALNPSSPKALLVLTYRIFIKNLLASEATILGMGKTYSSFFERLG